VTKRGCLDATTDASRITAWWEHRPFNIGIATGPSKLFVVDVDGEAGAAALQRLQDQHSGLPDTLQTRTARGVHYWYEMPNPAVHSSAGRIAAGIDVRGAGGYVVAPPSLHPNGGRYERAGADVIADAPTWLIDLATQSGGGGAPTGPSKWRELVADGACEGRRNTSVTRLVGHLLRCYVDPLVALQLVQSWNETRCRPPLPAEEVACIVDSIAGRELRRRGDGAGR
jgi:hypothetical protein